MQSSRPVRAFHWLVLLPVVGCGSNNPTDFNSPRDDIGGVSGSTPGGSAGMVQGGASGAAPGGSGGAPLSGSGGAQAGVGAGGSPAGGSAGSTLGGAAGTGAGGTSGGGGTTPNGGGPNGGTSGTGTVSFSCGSLSCVADRQYCVRTLPPISGAPEMRMCLPYPDSCGALSCDCFCKAPMNSPCGAASACMCSNNNGQITVVCGGS